MRKYITILIVLSLLACKKETINKTHTFQVTGNTAAMELTINGQTYYGGVQPVFTLEKGQTANFKDGGMYPNHIRITTISIDGKVVQQWNNQSGMFTYNYTAN